MHYRSPTGRVILGLVLALSLAFGSVAAIAATATNDSSIAGDATLAAPASNVHTSNMRHGQNSGSNAFAQVLCFIACMGLTATPSLASPDVVVLALPFFGTQSHVAGRNAGDQVLNRPTSPPPRGFATI